MSAQPCRFCGAVTARNCKSAADYRGCEFLASIEADEKTWITNMAKLEGDQEIGAGSVETMMRSRQNYRADRQRDPELLNRALGILHRMATENTGWRAFFRRWYFTDEPLRNDAASLVREARFGVPLPLNTQLLGGDHRP